MTRSEILRNILEKKVIAVIRMNDSAKLLKAVEAIYNGGISIMEITMTTPGALNRIEEARRETGEEIIIGAGSVLDGETARMALNAGAQFIVSPVYKKEIIKIAHRYGFPAIPGAYSPTEILTAYENGADIVKVFPAGIAGMAFLKAVKAPMPQLMLMPTGGVSLTNAGDWLKAGACAVGAGSALLNKRAIADEEYHKLTQNAKLLIENIRAAN